MLTGLQGNSRPAAIVTPVFQTMLSDHATETLHCCRLSVAWLTNKATVGQCSCRLSLVDQITGPPVAALLLTIEWSVSDTDSVSATDIASVLLLTECQCC